MTFFLLCLDIFRVKRFTNQNNDSRFPNGDRLHLFVWAALGDGNGGWQVVEKKKVEKETERGNREQQETGDRRRDKRGETEQPPMGKHYERGKTSHAFLTTLLNLLAGPHFSIFILDREERIADQGVSSSSCVPILIKKNGATPHLH